MPAFDAIGMDAVGANSSTTASTNGTASGAILTGTSTFSGGSASGTSASTAAGANLTGTSSFAGGSASATRNATAGGATLIGAGAFVGGSASASTGTPTTPPLPVGTITVPASRTAIFAGHPRVARFTDTAPVSLVKVMADQIYIVGDFTKPLADGLTTAFSVAPVSSGVVVVEAPQVQGSLCVVKLGALDPAGGFFTFRLTCANGEVIDGTILLTPLDDRTQVFGKDPDDHRYFAFDVSADLALGSNTTISTIQVPVAHGVSALSVPAIQGSKGVVLLGGLDIADGAVNSCQLVMTLANTEVIYRTAYFLRQDH